MLVAPVACFLCGQWFGVDHGAARGMAVFAPILSFALFFAAVPCGWRFLAAVEAIDAARRGGGTIVLMMMVGFLKLWFWLRMESNRVLREIQRLESQLARVIPR